MKIQEPSKMLERLFLTRHILIENWQRSYQKNVGKKGKRNKLRNFKCGPWKKI